MICLPAGHATCKWQWYNGEVPLVLRDYGFVGPEFYFWGLTPKYGEALMRVEGRHYYRPRWHI